MKSVISVLARRARAATSRPSVPRAIFQAFATQSPRGFATQRIVEDVPPEDYYNGHLIADHLEYLEDMMEVTLKMEESMMELQDIYDEKRLALEDMAETVTLDALFEKSAAQKSLLFGQIAELKTVLSNAKAFASDGPDGTSDAEVREGINEVNRIIDSAAKNEDGDSVRVRHAFERATKNARARDPEHDW
jgi:hypothetical protein